jgi:hypothetical protein
VGASHFQTSTPCVFEFSTLQEYCVTFNSVPNTSGKEDYCHVLEVKDAIYNAILGLVDIVRGTNSYYKLQILEKDHGSK